MTHIPRKSNINRMLESGKSVLVLGPRGTGKSYFLSKLLEEFSENLTINLLKYDDFQRYSLNHGLFSKDILYRLSSTTKTLYILVDEVQKIPSLLDQVHFLIEENKGKIVFILTGSSARKLKRHNANLLAGRALHFSFASFSIEEIDFNLNLHRILQYGSLPEVFTEQNTEIVEQYLKTYTHLYLKEEIQEEALVRNLESFSKALEYIAFTNGSLVNYSKIAKKISIDARTIKGYFEILVDTLILHKIPAWETSIKKQLQKASKYYLFDNGVINTLKGELKTEIKESSYRYGDLFENMVVNEILKYIDCNQLPHKVFHYLTRSNEEIDLIIQKNIFSPPIAIEIKSSSNPSKDHLKNLLEFKEEFPEAQLIILCTTPRAYEEKGIKILPFTEGISFAMGD